MMTPARLALEVHGEFRLLRSPLSRMPADLSFPHSVVSFDRSRSHSVSSQLSLRQMPSSPFGTA